MLLKVNKIFIVSLFLLAILSLGAASAADDIAADDLAVEDAGDIDLEVPAGEEISTDSDTDNVAVSDNVTFEDSSDDVLGASPDEELSAGTVTPTYTWSLDIPKMGSKSYVEYGQPIVVSGDFGNATGTVTFKLAGNAVDAVELVDGKFTCSITNYTLPSNSYVVFQGTYSGDDYYRSVSFPNTYVYIYLDDIVLEDIYVGQDQYINVDLHDATGYVNITFNNTSYRVKLENGKAVQKLEGCALGENNVLFEYEGDGNYNPFSKTLKFTYSEKENATIYSSVYKTADKNMVIVNIPNARGNNVTVTINGKKQVLDLVNCIAKYNLDASEVVTDLNVFYDGDSRFNPITSSDFVKLENNVVNNDTYRYYFDQSNYGKLFDFIEPGTTLDFQGSITNPDKNNWVFMDISIPVNIVSTTKDALVNLNSPDKYAVSPIIKANSFMISRGGSGSNITGITIYNTQVWLTNTSHVTLDSINITCMQRIGSGTGHTAIRDNTTYLTLKNSYIYSWNTGSSGFVLTWADYCTFENNTFAGRAGGNFIYFFAGSYKGTINAYNKFINNRIGDGVNSVNIVGGGLNTEFVNNTLLKCSGGGTYVVGNIVDGMGSTVTLSVASNGIAYNNYVTGSFSVSPNATVYNNTVLKAMTVAKESEVYNNTIGGLTLSGSDALVHNNIINGATTINAATNSKIYDNTFLGDYTIKFNNANAKNITFSGNDVMGNIEFGNNNAMNNKIVNNTITTSKDYAVDLKTFTNTENIIAGNVLYSKVGFGNNAVNTVDSTVLLNNSPSTPAEIIISVKDIKVGETAVFNITTNETSIASATVVVDAKKYNVTLSNGKGSLEVADLAFGKYDVTVTSNDLKYGAQNSTSFNVDKNAPPRIAVDAPVKTQWIDSNITVTIKRATGTVTLDINGTKLNAELVDGAVSFAVPDFAPGSYNFNITYSGDSRYEGAKSNGTLTVVKNKQVIILAEDIIAYDVANEFIAKFTNYIGEAIPNANVTITIGNAAYPKVTDENGTVNVGLMLFRGQYDVTVEFKAIPGEFDAVTAKYAIRVIDGSIMEIVSVDGEGIITGSLTDALGAPIADAKVIAKINGTNTTLTTDNAGLFQFQAQNGYQVVFAFEGDNITTLSEASITLNNVAHVLKEAVIDVSDVNVVAVDTAAGEKGKVYKFTLKDAQGNAIANKTVKAVLNGKVYDVVTDANGTASITISLNAAKTYSLDVFFLGDDDYKGATATAKVTVTKKSTTLKAAKTKYKFKAKAKSKVIKATLKTSNKYLKTGKKVTIKVKGKTYTAKTGKNGAIKLNLKSLKKKGTYKAKIKFAGDATYKASSSKTIKIVIK